ncbi:unnamed protein product [Ixodes pacificus]
MAPKKKGPFFFLMREIQNNTVFRTNSSNKTNRARWKTLASGRASCGDKFTSNGRPIAVLKEEQDRKQMLEHLVNQVHSYVEERGFLNDIKRSNFYLISFNILCEANGVYLPLELGLIEQGCTNTFHQFTDSGPIPLGFASLAKDHSDDTHGIPITGFKEGSRDYQGIVKEMLFFLQLSPDYQSLPPFFCTSDHMAQAKGCFRLLEVRSLHPDGLPRVERADTSAEAADRGRGAHLAPTRRPRTSWTAPSSTRRSSRCVPFMPKLTTRTVLLAKAGAWHTSSPMPFRRLTI